MNDQKTINVMRLLFKERLVNQTNLHSFKFNLNQPASESSIQPEQLPIQSRHDRARDCLTKIDKTQNPSSEQLGKARHSLGLRPRDVAKLAKFRVSASTVRRAERNGVKHKNRLILANIYREQGIAFLADQRTITPYGTRTSPGSSFWDGDGSEGGAAQSVDVNVPNRNPMK